MRQDMSALINPFYGRINRGDWWLLQLTIFVIAFLGIFISITFASDPNLPTSEKTTGEAVILLMIILLVAYMNFATCINRLRDSDTNRLWYFSFLLPTVGTGLMIYFCGVKASSDASYGATVQKYDTYNSY
jgi:uncharacterized membrane protein YhaH (DUF805 family)